VTDSELHEISKYARQAQQNNFSMQNNESIDESTATDFLCGKY